MDNTAFARALSFLNYLPFAKWLSMLCGVATAFLYVGLLLVLSLYADLMVNRGEIPAFHNLPMREKEQFLNRIKVPADEESRKALVERYETGLKELGLGEGPSVQVAGAEGTKPREIIFRQHVLWFAELPMLVGENVSENAAEVVRTKIRDKIKDVGVEAAVQSNLEETGILSLFVRSEGTIRGSLVAFLARLDDWMWAKGNVAYLEGLFLLGLVIGVARLGLLYSADFLAARATIEAITRLRKAVYQQTYRLGTLAFRALGPSEAVSVSTRHLEAVHTGLHTWLTVYFREPVKFGLLLLFAMLVNFWLALAFLLFALLVWLVGGQIAAYFRAGDARPRTRRPISWR